MIKGNIQLLTIIQLGEVTSQFRSKAWPPLVTGFISDILGNSAVGEI